MSGWMGGGSIFGGQQQGDSRQQAMANALMRAQPSPQQYSGSGAGSIWGSLGSGLSGAMSGLMSGPQGMDGLWALIRGQQQAAAQQAPGMTAGPMRPPLQRPAPQPVAPPPPDVLLNGN